MSDTWNPDFLHLSPVFKSIESVSRAYTTQAHWPTLEMLQKGFKHRGMPVQPVPQGDKPASFEEHYEPRIFLKGELQTRRNNWHDFFNAMIWLQFTETKKTLNQLHYHQARQRPPGTNRSPLENAITLFDECGCVLVSDKTELLELIRQHRWHELFWEKRELLDKHLQCIVVGHAMHEKALKPYIGMTAHALLILSPQLLNTCRQGKYDQLDQEISRQWLQEEIQHSRHLQPFPVLGMPGWHPDNNQQAFYLNENYFRKKPIAHT